MGNIPEVGNLSRKKRRREEWSFVVPDSVIVGERGKNEYENSLDPGQQEVCFFFFHTYITPRPFQNGGFETPAETGTLINFVAIGRARDKILSLKLDPASSQGFSY